MSDKSDENLEERVKRIPIEELRKAYISEIMEWVYIDDEVKRIASQVLSKDELEDAPVYDRFIGAIEVVEILVEKIKKLKNENSNT